MFKRNLLNFTLISILFLLICIMPKVALAVEQRTTTLDLTTQNATIDMLSEEGWSWNNDTQTLTLKNANFDVTDSPEGTPTPCIKFPTNKKVTVIFEGNNTLIAQKGSVFNGVDDPATGIDGTETGSITFKSPNKGTLNLKVTESSSRGTYGNLGCVMKDVHDLNILSGTINCIGGIMSDGTVTISGGKLDINTENMTDGMSSTVEGIYAIKQVKITGGNVNIKSSNTSIKVPGMQGQLPDVEDGIIINGGNISLSTQSKYTIYTGNYRQKDIKINGGNITLKSEVGIYTNKGDIYINNIDSLDDTNVTGKTFQVNEGNAENEIKVATADYSNVDKAIEKAKKLNKNDYVDFSAVEAAINAVIRNKSILEQEEVDAMAKDIEDAINSLELVKNNDDKSDDNSNKDITPKTGSVDKINYLYVLAVISLAGSIILKRI